VTFAEGVSVVPNVVFEVEDESLINGVITSVLIIVVVKLIAVPGILVVVASVGGVGLVDSRGIEVDVVVVGFTVISVDGEVVGTVSVVVVKEVGVGDVNEVEVVVSGLIVVGIGVVVVVKSVLGFSVVVSSGPDGMMLLEVSSCVVVGDNVVIEVGSVVVSFIVVDSVVEVASVVVKVISVVVKMVSIVDSSVVTVELVVDSDEKSGSVSNSCCFVVKDKSVVGILIWVKSSEVVSGSSVVVNVPLSLEGPLVDGVVVTLM